MDWFTLIAGVGIALVFDFTNGFHDPANAIATVISTRALQPKVAVGMAAVLNFAGAFYSFKVAATIAGGIVNPDLISVKIILAALVGAITWNLITWSIGLPSSSSHALIGGMIGAMIGRYGLHGVVDGQSVPSIQWHGLVDKVLKPSLIGPLLAIPMA